MAEITLTVNGRQAQISTNADRPLLDVLREDLKLTGAKFGCGEGECGACSVLVEGKRVFSCSTPVGEVAGKSVTTIEGISQYGKLHPVQEAFVAEGASQCGFCTTGMIMTAVALLNENPKATAMEIVAGMNGNLCRCCSYPKIVSAIQRVAEGGK